ncbi:MAG TPA: tetratricopeptide repeat protein [Myxococcales bacterium]|jgi:TolA-binding protein
MRRPTAIAFALAAALALAAPARAQAAAAAVAKGDAKKDAKKGEEAKAPAAAAATGGPQVKSDAERAADEKKAAVVPSERRERGRFEGMGKTPDEEAEYADLAAAVRDYEEQAKEYRKEIQLLIEKKYEEKRKGLEASYEKAISDIEVLERKERLDAIAMFEEFLQRYPEEPKYTPDVMFRLAELYYEKTKDDYNLAMKEYEDQLKLVEAGKLAAAPPEPKQSFQRSVELYQTLITKFPDYRFNDASRYLLGFCLEKQGELEQSRDTFRRLIEMYPTSRYVPEAWVRLGEYYFDAVGEPQALENAAEAYAKAATFKDHPLYDKAIYKLGWTYYRMDNFDRAVDAFVQLVDFYDQQSKEKGEEEAGGDLRTEALQYMAISFADEKWGSIAKAQELFGRIGPRPWEAELWKRLGDVYSDQTKWDDAIAAFKQNLAKDPTNPGAPQIQDKIVKAFEQGKRDFEGAFGERELLVKNYAPGSPWYEKNKSNSDVIKGAQELSEKSLYSAAIYHHQQALQHVKNDKLDQAKREFEIAARGYDDYLKRFPHSKVAYELEYYLADCLYSSLQFLSAAKHFEAVRDSTADTRFLADAAYNAVLAYQKEIDSQQKATPPVLETKAVFTSKDWPESKSVTKQELPELWKKFVSAGDGFIKMQPKHEGAPKIAYRAAEAFYVYEDFEEARRRFAAIAENHPGSEFAKFASNLTLETFLITKDWVAVTNFTNELIKPGKDGKAKVDPKSDAGKILGGFGDNAMFKQAEKLMADKKWDEAGKLYEDLVDRNRDYQFADKALNNAAVCRENARRFESALKLYERIYTEYTKSDLADVALFRVAVNAENSYDHEKAVERYKKLVDTYPKSKDRPAALNNLARLLEALQRYQDAAKQFTRFAELYPTDEDAPKNLYKAATIYEKMNDCTKEIQSLNEFIRKFSKDAKQSERVVDAYKRIGDCQRGLKNETGARASFLTATQEYKKRALTGKEEAASAAAGYSRFQLAEIEYKKWDDIKLTGRGKALENAFKAKLTEAKKLQDSYSEIYNFKSVEWILAASYKKGFVLERFATTLVESPCPQDIKAAYGEEGCDMYRATLVEKVTGMEEKAVEAYQTTAKECREKQLVDNEWCDRTQESLARLRSDFKVLKKARSVTVPTTFYPSSTVETIEGPAVKKPANAGKLGEDKD